MSVPEVVHERLAGERPSERVSLGGDDQLIVTPTRTLLYRSEGLLSGESVEEYPHDVEQIAVNEGRRRTTVHLDHGIDGDSEFHLPASKTEECLRPILSGILRRVDVLEEDESVTGVFRIGELSIILSEGRVIEHVGAALWDEDFESFPFADVTHLDIEHGDVSSQLVIEANGRPERIKLPSEDARVVRTQIERQLLAYHDVPDYATFRERVAPGDEAEPSTVDDPQTEPLEVPALERDDGEATTRSDAERIDRIDAPAAEDVSADGDLAAEVAALRTAVEEHGERLERQRETIEELIDELRRGR